MFKEEFLAIFKILGINGTDHTDEARTTQELVDQMRADPEYLLDNQSLMEHRIRRESGFGECLCQLLMSTARYVSDLARGDVPILVPRDEVEACVGLVRSQDAEAIKLGRVMQQAIQSQVDDSSQGRNQQLLEQIQKMMAGAVASLPPTSERYLDTRAIAQRLDLAPKTVRRLCEQGHIDADKTRGGQWRTTLDRLERSPYLNGKRKWGESHA